MSDYSDHDALARLDRSREGLDEVYVFRSPNRGSVAFGHREDADAYDAACARHAERFGYSTLRTVEALKVLDHAGARRLIEREG